jgi:alkylhydroperoxidase family enzyme
LDAWRESELYTERGRAVLVWAEAVTLVAQTHVTNAVCNEARHRSSEDKLVKLILLTATINTWNWVAFGFRSVHPTKAARTRV